MALEVALSVWDEIQNRQQESERLRRQQVEREKCEADLARGRCMQVDPANRLVADSLEADWNEKLRALAEAQERYEQRRQADQALAKRIERKRILEDVALMKS